MIKYPIPIETRVPQEQPKGLEWASRWSGTFLQYRRNGEGGLSQPWSRTIHNKFALASPDVIRFQVLKLLPQIYKQE